MANVSEKAVTRIINWEVTIARPNYNLDSFVLQAPKVIFTSTKVVGAVSLYSNDLIAYTFKNSIKEIDPPFSLTVTPNEVSDQKTWLDILQVRDIVIFKEFGKIRYIGVISDKYYTSSMSSEGKPHRVIHFGGKGLTSLLQDTPLIMDLHIWTGAGLPVETINKEFLASINVNPDQDQRLGPLLKRIYTKYFTLMKSMGTAAGAPTSGLEALMSQFLDLDSGMSSDVTALYPLALSVFRVGSNNLWDIWRSIVPGPYYELFGRWEPTEEVDQVKQKIIVRKAPFNATDWRSLTLSRIPNIAITSLDLGQTDGEVVTYYQALLPGALINENQVKAISEYANGRKVDSDLWNTYGYKPMFIDFQYFNRSTAGAGSLAQVLQTVTDDMYNWFKRNKDFYSGSITYMSFPDGPKIGERLELYDNAQFYIEESETQWTYGGPLQSTLTLTRGYRYDGSGNATTVLEKQGYLLSGTEDNAGSKASGFKYE